MRSQTPHLVRECQAICSVPRPTGHHATGSSLSTPGQTVRPGKWAVVKFNSR